MTTEAQIKDAQDALINAHNAGDEEAARKIADHIVSLQSQQQQPSESRTLDKAAGAIYGAAAGMPAGLGLQAAIREEFPNAFKRVPTAAQTGIPNVTVVGSPATPSMHGGENWTKAMTGVDVPGAQMEKASLDTAKNMAASVGRGGELAGGKIVNGILVGPQTAAERISGQAAEVTNKASLVDRAKAAAKAAVDLDNLKSVNKNVGHVLHGATNPMIAKLAGNALGGAGVGMQGADAYNRFKDPNQGWVRSAISGLGAAGSGAAMTRVPALMLPGMAVGTAAPFINDYLDEWAKEHPEAAKKLHLAGGGEVNLKPRSAIGVAPYGMRHDSFTPKGKGYFGEVPNTAGGVSTELSAYSPELGDYPLMAPTMSRSELNSLVNNEDPTEAVHEKAQQWAKKRKSEGKSPFAQAGELRIPLPHEEHMANGGFVKHFKDGKAVVAEEIFKGAKKLFTPKESTVARMSDALSNDIGKWFRPTQADRMRAEQGDLGGMGFSKFQNEKPEYAEAKSAWGVMNPTAATRIANLNAEKGAGNTIWTPMLGSPTQHHSNQHVHDTLVEEFNRKNRTGELPPELRGALNARMQTYIDRKTGFPIFTPEADIGDPEQLSKLGTTFAKRAALGELFSGKGVGGRKGSIIPYNDIMTEYTDPAARNLETHSLGNRLFTLTGEHSYRPDLHSAFPQNLAGEDRAVVIKDLPAFEVGMPDWNRSFREAHGGRKPGFFDKTLGSKQVGYPIQEITEPYLESLYKAGYAEGGEVKHMAAGKLTSGLSTMPKKQIEEMQKLEQAHNYFSNRPAYQKAEMIGEALSGVPELAASFHPGYGVGYAGSALYDAMANTGDYGGAAADVAFNAPGILKPIGAAAKAVAPAARAALPYIGGLGALGAADAAEAGQGSKLKQIMSGVMEQYAPKAAKEMVPGIPHSYGPKATGDWVRDYQPAARPEPQISYMGKYVQPTQENMVAQKSQMNADIQNAINNRKAQWIMRSKQMGMSDAQIADEIAHSSSPPWMP